MPGVSFQKIVSMAELLNATLKERLTEMPHLKGESDELEQFLGEVKGLSQEQETLRGRLREIVRLRQEAERHGAELHSRVAAQLKGKLGFTNENLMAYGITPRKRERKKPEKHRAPEAKHEAAEPAEPTP